MNASYKVISYETACIIYDSKDKVIGKISAKNGQYCVDHEISVNVTMAGEGQEILMVEALCCWMGHIALEIAKKMVSTGAIDGIRLDLTSEIRQCDSCKYAKATRKPIKRDRQTL